MSVQRLESDIELYTEEALHNPYPIYKELRDMEGPVWLNAYGMYVFSRYDDVKNALANPEVFSSASGVTMNDRMNETLSGGLLCSDSPRHDVLRKVIEKPLLPKQLNALRNTIVEEAEAHVERLVGKKNFDAATDLAQYLPLSVVSNLVGLPEAGRERMLDWAPANFDCFGPESSQRTQSAFPIVQEMVKYAFEECTPEKLKPGSWAAQIWEAANRGEISHEDCPHMMNDYLGPALDTTIFATGSAIWLFSQNPEQWDKIRENPTLIPNAINEVIRIESPIQGFSRVTTQDYELDGHVVPENSRVIVLYGSANRDERVWDDPNKFDVTRNSSGHLGFGFGEHQCVGNNLARLEIRALLIALAKRVKRFELGDMERATNNVLRGIAKCEVTVY
jgi:cytochrome P450